MRSAPVLRRISALLLVGFAASCTKAKLGEPTPTGITVSADATTISADSGSLTVHAQTYENGTALLNQPITFALTGAATASMTASTDPLTGVATATFTGVTAAGSVTVTASAGVVPDVVSATQNVTVVHGAASSLAVGVSTQTIDADAATISTTSTVKDKSNNAIDDATVELTTDAPGAQVGDTSIGGLHVAGGFKIFGRVAGVTSAGLATILTDSAPFTITAGAPAQAVANVGQSAIGRLGTLDLYCDEKDGFGNLTPGTFVATTNVFTTPASTIAHVSGNHFTASGFATAGNYVATCSLNSHVDTKSFQVVAQNPTNSVTASLSSSVVQAASGSTTLTCSEVDGFGNPVTATFTPSLSGPSAGTVSGSSPVFTISNLTAKGAYSATCTDGGLSDSKDFSAIDTTAPGIDLALVAASGPNGVTGDGRYAPGTDLTFRVTASDAVGVANESLTVSGPAQLVGSDIHAESGATAPAAYDFVVHVLGNAPTFAPIAVSAQATDTSGNTKIATQTFALVIDPAAAMVAASGVTIRTVFEQKTSISPFPLALASTGSSLYVTRALDPSDKESDVILISTTPGSSFMTVFADFVAAGDDVATEGLVVTPSFGGQTLFQSVAGGGGSIASIAGSTGTTFSTDPTVPVDLTYGTVGTTTGLVYTDRGGASDEIRMLDPSGVSTSIFMDSTSILSGPGSISGVAISGTDLLVGGTSSTLIYRIDGTTHLPSVFAPMMNFTADIAVGSSGEVLVSTDAANLLRYSSTGTALADVSDDFTATTAMAVDASNNLFVADSGIPSAAGGTVWRIYKVTGY